MKKLLTIIFLACALISCQPDLQDLPTPTALDTCTNMSLFKNVVWKNVIDTLPDFKFTDANVYHSGMTGTWSLSNNCDIVLVHDTSYGGYVFYFQITSLTADTMKTYNMTANIYTGYKATSVFHR